ncbi:MAG: hypothetical protein M1831_004563 [Alyxoria varia]|nr:MAG: hypothetical protein M1831_004563 [Alyxoria varia]
MDPGLSVKMPAATAENNPPSTQPLLSLPSAAFAKVAPTSFLTAHLSSPEQFVSAPDSAVRSRTRTRPNLRGLNDSRRPICHTSSLSHCSGSAVVRAGQTSVVCGVQPEILLRKDVPDPPRTAQDSGLGNSAVKQELMEEQEGANEIERLGLLVPNVELATGCSPAHVPAQSRAPNTEAQSLASKLLRLLHVTRVVKMQDLRIRERNLSSYVKAQDHQPSSESASAADDGERETIAYWSLHINIHVLSLSGITSLMDIVWSALLAALKDTLLPHAWWDEDRQLIVCSDRRDTATRIGVTGLPIAMTWGVFEAEKNGVKVEDGDETESANKMDVDEVDHDEADIGQLGEGLYLLADPDALEEQVCSEFLCMVVDCTQLKQSLPRLLHMSKTGGSAIGPKQISRIPIHGDRMVDRKDDTMDVDPPEDGPGDSKARDWNDKNVMDIDSKGRRPQEQNLRPESGTGKVLEDNKAHESKIENVTEMDVDSTGGLPQGQTLRSGSESGEILEEQKSQGPKPEDATEMDIDSDHHQDQGTDPGTGKVSEDESRPSSSQKSEKSNKDNSATQKLTSGPEDAQAKCPKKPSNLKKELEVELKPVGYEYVLFGVREEYALKRLKKYEGHVSLQNLLPWPEDLEPPMPVPRELCLSTPMRVTEQAYQFLVEEHGDLQGFMSAKGYDIKDEYHCLAAETTLFWEAWEHRREHVQAQSPEQVPSHPQVESKEQTKGGEQGETYGQASSRNHVPLHPQLGGIPANTQMRKANQSIEQSTDSGQERGPDYFLKDKFKTDVHKPEMADAELAEATERNMSLREFRAQKAEAERIERKRFKPDFKPEPFPKAERPATEGHSDSSSELWASDSEDAEVAANLGLSVEEFRDLLWEEEQRQMQNTPSYKPEPSAKPKSPATKEKDNPGPEGFGPSNSKDAEEAANFGMSVEVYRVRRLQQEEREMQSRPDSKPESSAKPKSPATKGNVISASEGLQAYDSKDAEEAANLGLDVEEYRALRLQEEEREMRDKHEYQPQSSPKAKSPVTEEMDSGFGGLQASDSEDAEEAAICGVPVAVYRDLRRADEEMRMQLMRDLKPEPSAEAKSLAMEEKDNSGSEGLKTSDLPQRDMGHAKQGQLGEQDPFVPSPSISEGQLGMSQRDNPQMAKQPNLNLSAETFRKIMGPSENNKKSESHVGVPSRNTADIALDSDRLSPVEKSKRDHKQEMGMWTELNRIALENHPSGQQSLELRSHNEEEQKQSEQEHTNAQDQLHPLERQYGSYSQQQHSKKSSDFSWGTFGKLNRSWQRELKKRGLPPGGLVEQQGKEKEVKAREGQQSQQTQPSSQSGAQDQPKTAPLLLLGREQETSGTEGRHPTELQPDQGTLYRPWNGKENIDPALRTAPGTFPQQRKQDIPTSHPRPSTEPQREPSEQHGHGKEEDDAAESPVSDAGEDEHPRPGGFDGAYDEDDVAGSRAAAQNPYRRMKPIRALGIMGDRSFLASQVCQGLWLIPEVPEDVQDQETLLEQIRMEVLGDAQTVRIGRAELIKEGVLAYDGRWVERGTSYARELVAAAERTLGLEKRKENARPLRSDCPSREGNWVLASKESPSNEFVSRASSLRDKAKRACALGEVDSKPVPVHSGVLQQETDPSKVGSMAPSLQQTPSPEATSSPYSTIRPDHIICSPRSPIQDDDDSDDEEEQVQRSCSAPPSPQHSHAATFPECNNHSPVTEVPTYAPHLTRSPPSLDVTERSDPDSPSKRHSHPDWPSSPSKRRRWNRTSADSTNVWEREERRTTRLRWRRDRDEFIEQLYTNPRKREMNEVWAELSALRRDLDELEFKRDKGKGKAQGAEGTASGLRREGEMYWLEGEYCRVLGEMKENEAEMEIMRGVVRDEGLLEDQWGRLVQEAEGLKRDRERLREVD